MYTSYLVICNQGECCVPSSRRRQLGVTLIRMNCAKHPHRRQAAALSCIGLPIALVSAHTTRNQTSVSETSLLRATSHVPATDLLPSFA